MSKIVIFLIIISRFAELVVAINFLSLAFLWVTREPEFVPGWAELLQHKETIELRNYTGDVMTVTKQTKITS